ncbi:MAG TPA: hypothetical protein VNM15_03300 [Candidatus Binatia bacterium]|nr:hypothetical protein [Candidatus Binatia bacterium]
MKSFRATAPQRSLPEEAREIAHQLLNQLSVLNFCCFRVRNKAASAGALKGETERLARAIEEATLCAERLSRAIATSTEPQNHPSRRPKKPQRRSAVCAAF